MHITAPEALHTAPARAEAWGVSRRTLFGWLRDYRDSGGRRGLGPSYRIGRAWCVPATACARFLRSRRLPNVERRGTLLAGPGRVF